ncbi:MAG: enolase C-terminal domain-like protein [Cyanobacteria bacterium P01_D01_bin.115]
MKIVAATIFALQIPFVEAFAHSIRHRAYSDAMVVRVVAADGTVGYGEAIARPYVTGETVESCLQFMTNTLWPAVLQQDYPPPSVDASTGVDWLNQVSLTLPNNPAGSEPPDPSVVAWHAARTGWELALVDCLLQSAGRSLGEILPPQRATVTYSGVITASGIEQAVKVAKRFKQFGLSHLKVKVTGRDDRARVAAIRDAVGAEPLIRLDGNGAYTVESAIAACDTLAEFAIASAEQLIPRGNPADYAQLQAATAIPQIADESLITLADAQALIAAQACQGFNLRLSKCGGLAQTLAIARLAEQANVFVQVGCQVGETAILSAAGRHLAAGLPQVKFVEGSYGKLLLGQDISRIPVQFGYRGQAPVLTRPGLGVEVQDEAIAAHAHQTLRLETPSSVHH